MNGSFKRSFRPELISDYVTMFFSPLFQRMHSISLKWMKYVSIQISDRTMLKTETKIECQKFQDMTQVNVSYGTPIACIFYEKKQMYDTKFTTSLRRKNDQVSQLITYEVQNEPKYSRLT